MRPFSFVYEGKVRGQGRPRFGNGRAYEAKNDTEYKKAVREAYIASGGPFFGESPVSLCVHVFRSLPKTTPKKVLSAQDVQKPDADNIAKAVLDALNGVAYGDDSQVVSLTVRKHPRTRIQEHFVATIAEAE